LLQKKEEGEPILGLDMDTSLCRKQRNIVWICWINW